MHESLPITTILLVDDDEGKRYSVAKILKRAKFQVREVATGAEALVRAAEKPDLIILDVKLPDISGFEVCRRIKADPATATIPVLHLSTTFVEIEDKVHGLEGGADGYLTDVLEPLELIATVNA
ncbi:response regulator transcription factor, partial [Singulisphaera rosea]